MIQHTSSNHKFHQLLSFSFTIQLSKAIGTVVSAIVLMRLLDPEAFGLLGIARVFIEFGWLWAGLIMGKAIINDDKITSLALSSIFWLLIFLSIGIIGLFVGMAYLIAWWYENQMLIEIVMILSLTIFFQAMSMVPDALLQKRLQLRAQGMVWLIAFGVSFGSAIYLANNGYGVWSLVYQLLLFYGFQAVGSLLIVHWKPDLAFSLISIKSHIAYVKPLLGSESLTYIATKMDDYLIGKYQGVTELGIYNRAYTLVALPFRLLSRAYNQILFPIFSEAKENETLLRTQFQKTFLELSYLMWPIISWGIYYRDVLIEEVLGKNWLPMSDLILPFAIAGGLRAWISMTQNIYLSLGETKKVARLNYWMQGLIIIGILIGINFGLVAVAYAYLIVTGFMLVPFFSGALSLIKLKRIGTFLKHLLLLVPAIFLLLLLFGQMNFWLGAVFTIFVSVGLLILKR